MAEADGEVVIFVANEAHCKLIRNKCYAFRSQRRKQNAAVTGVALSHLDAFQFSYGMCGNQSAYPDQYPKWYFRIAFDDIVEFELLIPETHEGDLPHFDIPIEEEGGVPHITTPGYTAEDEFHLTHGPAIGDYLSTQQTQSDEETPF